MATATLEPPAPERMPPGSVVYYFGNPTTRAVKIGTTMRLAGRMRDLSLESGTQLVLLATEPGGRRTELRRHRQFGRLRLIGEWFRKDPWLMKHVGEVRIKHGILESQGGAPDPKFIAPLRLDGGAS